MASTTPPKVDSFGQKPPAAGSKPAPPDGFGQLPGSGDAARGSDPAPEATELGSVVGMPSGVQQMNPTENRQSKKFLGPTSKSVTGSPRESMPSGVQKGFNQKP